MTWKSILRGEEETNTLTIYKIEQKLTYREESQTRHITLHTRQERYYHTDILHLTENLYIQLYSIERRDVTTPAID